jgi:hypothetical protein
MAVSVKAERPMRTLGAVLHDTGCRIGETLTPVRVDLTGRALVFESLKKRCRGVYRAVPVPPARLDALDLVHGVREARRGLCRAAALAVQPDDRVAAGHHCYGSGRPPGRTAPLAQGPAPRLWGARDREQRAAQQAQHVDGPCHPRGDSDRRQRARRRLPFGPALSPAPSRVPPGRTCCSSRPAAR